MSENTENKPVVFAIPHEDGKVYQHFGKSTEFKLYTIDNGEVSGQEIVSTEASGHDEVAAFLRDKGVEIVICGNIGQGAMEALMSSGILVSSGAEGDCDEVFNNFIEGALESQGANCNCGGDGEGCGCGCGDGEGGCCGCGGGCGGCGGGAPAIRYEGKNAGKRVKTHYHGTLDDGSVFDSSYERNEPLEFIAGVGMMIPGFDKAVVDMNVGDIVNIHLEPEEAYGEKNPAMIMEIEIDRLPGAERLNEGDSAYLQDAYGRPLPITVVAKTDKTITLDANHEMAGKALNFKIELVEVAE